MQYSVSFVFDEHKATQASAYLLGLNKGRMNYMKLMKILYLSDRRFILDWGNSITTDNYVSMDNGPVISRIYDLIKDSNIDTGTYWASCIRTIGYEVFLQKNPGVDCLSPMEMEIIERVNSEFEGFSEWDLVDFCHKNLPEWQNPHGSSIQISIEDILSAEKKGEEYNQAIGEIQLAAEIQKSNYFMQRARKL